VASLHCVQNMALCRRSNDIPLRDKREIAPFSVRGVVLGKVLFCNSFEVGHTKEVVILILRFESPDGFKETVYVTISPAGATVLNEHLGKELADYMKEYGKIDLDAWKKTQPPNSNCSSAEKYLS